MTTPNRSLLDDPRTLTIELDGVKWPVPKLAPKQNEIVVPLILKTVPRIMQAMVDIKPVEGEAVDQTKRRVEIDLPKLAAVLTEQGTKDLYTIVYWALERGHKGLTKEEFEDMPIGVLDAVEAVMVVAKQTGVLRRSAGGDTKPGEAPAAA